MVEKAKVYLVGAGPGWADLITVRGAEVLGKADCIIYDKLANPALLKFAHSNTEIIGMPKRIGKGSATQEQINKLLVEKASSGKTVVRLKGGDPCIFGRCAEELAALAEAGIDFEIVPGVTAGVAVSAYTGIILTDRDYSSQVVFVTGQEAKGKQKSNIDWHLLAKFNGTIVFYMAMGNLNSIANRLIENGKLQETPAAVIANVTLPTQRVVKASLGKISTECKQQKIEPPAIVVIGPAADSDTRLNWFRKKPLFGKNIVVTRDAAGNTDFAAKIICRGGNPLEFPTLRIKPLTESNEFLQTLAKLAQYNWIIFTSANGVAIFFETLQKLDKDARAFGSARIAAIGCQTADKLTQFGIKADFVPTIYTSRELGKQLAASWNLHSKKVLLLRSHIASNELNEWLKHVGAIVDDVAIYTTIREKSESSWLIEGISKGTIDWLTFASPSSVDGFFEQIPSELVKSSKVRVASIGPVTSEQLKNLGIRIDAEAAEHTIDRLLAAIEVMYT